MPQNNEGIIEFCFRNALIAALKLRNYAYQVGFLISKFMM